MPGRDGAPIDPTTGVVGSFEIEELLDSRGDVRTFRGHDERVNRRVLLRVAGAASADVLVEDARRLSTVSHPGLVVVLEASRSQSAAYAAVQELDSLPLSEAGRLSSQQAARVGLDIAGAIAALAEAGLRAPINAGTVQVVQSDAGVHGLLDPMRNPVPGQSCVTDSDPASSAAELAGVIERATHAPSAELREAIGVARSGASSAPADLASALAPLVAPRSRARSRRGRALVAAAGSLALAIIAVIAIALNHGGTSGHAAPRRKPVTARPAPTAHVVARIPLGLLGKEYVAEYVGLGHTMWLATSAGRLLRVDVASNEVTGTPIDLGKQHSFWAITTTGGMLYTTDTAGWLLRIDPRTGRVTGRRHLAPELTFVRAVGGVLWLVATPFGGSTSSVLRVSPRTFRLIGKPLKAVSRPLALAVRGTRAWVLGGLSDGKLARVDAATGARRVVNVGPNPETIALDGNKLWITDRFDGTVAALDADRLSFTGEVVHTPRSAYGVATAGADVWVTAADSLQYTGTRLRVERFDSRTGRRVGVDVPVGHGASGIHRMLGSFWVNGSDSLVRLSATNPRPALSAPAPVERAPFTLQPGPIGQGTWRTTKFVAPFRISTPASGWIAGYPEPDAVSFVAAGERFAELDIIAPRQVFTNDAGATQAIGDPTSLLQTLRRNPHLIVGRARHITIGGRQALQVDLHARRPVPHHPEVCGPPACALLFPAQDATYTVDAGDVARVVLLQSAGHTIVMFEGGNGDDPVAQAAAASVARTIAFAK